MKCLKASVRAPDLFEVPREVTDAPSLERTAVHHFKPLPERRCMVLEEFHGEAGTYERLARESPRVSGCRTFENGIRMGFLEFDPTPVTYQVFARLQRSPVVLEGPFQVTDEGLKLLLGGDDQAMQNLYTVLPDGVDVDIIEIEEFVPSVRRSYSSLTARQREILETAIEMGFYENPRRATYEDIADELDLSSSTVGEHVRKIERVVFSSIMPSVS